MLFLSPQQSLIYFFFIVLDHGATSITKFVFLTGWMSVQVDWNPNFVMAMLQIHLYVTIRTYKLTNISHNTHTHIYNIHWNRGVLTNICHNTKTSTHFDIYMMGLTNCHNMDTQTHSVTEKDILQYFHPWGVTGLIECFSVLSHPRMEALKNKLSVLSPVTPWEAWKWELTWDCMYPRYPR